jgi:hypothetical protein
VLDGNPEFLKIQRAFYFFDCFARHAMGIDHRSPYIAVAQKGLASADIVVGLKEMSCKRVAGNRDRPFLKGSLIKLQYIIRDRKH